MDENKPKRERKQRSAQRDALHAKNWKEYTASVEDIQNFLMDRIMLRRNVILSVARAMQVVSQNISQKLSAVHLGRAFGELGFKRVKYNNQRGYIVVQRTGQEVEYMQRKMADEAVVDSVFTVLLSSR